MTAHDLDTAHPSPRQAIGGWLQLALVVGLVVVALAINRILSASSGAPEVPQVSAEALVVEVMTPQAIPSEFLLRESGVVQARSLVGVTPQVGGRVVSVSPDFVVGGSFRAEQTLFQIDETDYTLALNRALADLQTARSNLQLELAEAETAWREWRIVNGNDPIPSLVARQPQIAQALAGVASAEARLADAETALARTRFSLPFDGRVLSSTIEPGQTVSPGQSFGEVYPNDSLEVTVSVTLDELDRLQPAVGRSAVVVGEGAGRQIRVSGQVLRAEAALDGRTRQAGLTVGFNEPASFLPGRFVTVDIIGDQYPATFHLNASAVSPSGAVWVVEDGQLAARRPEILTRDDAVVTTLPFDTAQGVVITALASAREGMAVETSASLGGAALDDQPARR